MKGLRLFSASASIIFPLSFASAQSDPAPPLITEPAKWEFSLGADPTHFDLRTKDPGVDLRMISTITRNWQTPLSNFSRQVNLMVGADAPHGTGPTCYGCWSMITKQYAALTAGASVDLFRAWRFTPYLHSATGLYYTHLGGGTSNISDGLVPRPPRNDFSLGLNGGLGIRARLFSHEFFIDQTLHAVDVNTPDQGIFPLSIGIRW